MHKGKFFTRVKNNNKTTYHGLGTKKIAKKVLIVNKMLKKRKKLLLLENIYTYQGLR